METHGLAILPCLWAAWTVIGLAVSYILTMTKGHASTFLIYISDTGAGSPESIIFTTVFSVSAVLGTVTIYIMYRFMTIRTAAVDLRYRWIHKVLLILGWISCLGLLLVAVFQVRINPEIHRTGAAIAFCFGLFYTVCQTVYLYPVTYSGKVTCCIRLALCTLMDVCLFIFLVGKVMVYRNSCQERLCEKIFDGSAIVSEWLSALFLMLYFLTYFTDFQHLCIKWQKSLKDDWIVLREEIHNGPELP